MSTASAPTGKEVAHPNAVDGSSDVAVSVHAPSNSVDTTARLPPPDGPDHPPSTWASGLAWVAVILWRSAGEPEATIRCVLASAARTPAGGSATAFRQIASPACGT